MAPNKKKLRIKQREQIKKAIARRKKGNISPWNPEKDPLPPEIIKEWQKARMEEEFRNRLGIPRPIISAEFKGKRHIAVGSSMYWGKWKTFTEFLFYYASSMMGQEWGTQELKKTFGEMHPLLQLYVRARQFQNEQKAGPNGFYDVVPSGALYAFLLFSYDLYIVGHNSKVQNELLHRLRINDQFQGARYELFAAATCIRAGFELDFEDEKDSNKRHVEFIATHKRTSQKICVEAKSKHRGGVLGFEGTMNDWKTIRVRIGQLLNNALSKNFSYPLVVFLDFNLPPELAMQVFKNNTLSNEFKRIIYQINIKYGNKDKFNLLVCTNHPFHYGSDNEKYPRPHTIGILGQNPEIKADYPQAIIAIYDAANSYGRIPNEFPQDKIIIGK